MFFPTNCKLCGLKLKWTYAKSISQNLLECYTDNYRIYSINNSIREMTDIGNDFRIINYIDEDIAKYRVISFIKARNPESFVFIGTIDLSIGYNKLLNKCKISLLYK